MSTFLFSKDVAVILDALIQKQPLGSVGRQALTAYREGKPVAGFRFTEREDQAAVIQGAALLGDRETFHRVLDETSLATPLRWTTDVYHPFYLAHKAGHEDLLERVADPQMIKDMADQLSNEDMVAVDVFLADSVRAGVREPAEAWLSMLPHGLAQTRAAFPVRLALERARQAELTAAPPVLRGRPRVRS